MRPERLLPLLFVGVALVVFRGSVFEGRAEIPCNPNRWLPWRLHASAEEIAPPAVNSDTPLAYFPRRVFATERMRAGDLPLWDPFTFTGQPFLANYQSALFYPINLLLYAVEPMRATGWHLLIHFVLAGFFFYRCARSFGLAPGPSAAGALLFELNPFFLTRIGHPTFVATAAWLPLAILAARRLARAPTAGNAAFLAGSLALAAFAGFPQTLVHIAYAVGFCMLLALAMDPEVRKTRAAFVFAGSALLAAGIAAVQILPTAELLRLSTRDALDLPTFLSGTHHPAMLVKTVVPDFFGNPMRENLWSTLFQSGNGLFRQNYVSTLNYFGVLPLAIGLYGLAAGRSRLFLLGLFLFPLLVLWGTPFAEAAFHLPGFRFSRPDRLILLPLFANALAFAFGLERLNRRPRAVSSGVCAVLGLFLLLGGAAALFRDPLVRFFLDGRALVAGGIAELPAGPVSLDSLAGTVLVSALTTVLLAAVSLVLLFARPRVGARGFLAGVLLLAGGDLLLFHSRFHLDLPPEILFRETPEIARIREELGAHGRIARFGPGATDLLPPATASLYGIHDVGGINAINLERYRRFLELIEPGLYGYRRYRPFHRPESLSSPLLRLLGARVYGVDTEGRVLPMTVGEPLPRASLHHTWETLPEKKILERLRSPSFDPAGTVYLEEPAPTPPGVSGGGSASIELYEPDRVVVRTESGADSFLLLADAWFPGWTASVDGAPAKIYRADYAFRGVHLPAGGHVVDFRYRPASFRVGGIVSLLSLGAAVILLIKDRRRRGG
ncbi:MAG: YfhO family protein [Candidatus Eisenbacteria bacterium]|nr:YfhO family protein [Candidatus Eisenbacteria bacterium]